MMARRMLKFIFLCKYSYNFYFLNSHIALGAWFLKLEFFGRYFHEEKCGGDNDVIPCDAPGKCFDICS